MKKPIILANPAAGSPRLNKYKFLEDAARFIDNCDIVGLETKSRQEFIALASELAKSFDPIIVAGGDGTLSDVINATNDVTLGYIPMGSGNAFMYSVNLPRDPMEAAIRIYFGKENEIDLVECNSKKALLTSVGLEASILGRTEDYTQKGIPKKFAYVFGTARALMNGVPRYDAQVTLDKTLMNPIQGTLTVIVSKIPKYGYDFTPLPLADPSDGMLHAIAVSSSKPRVAYDCLRAFNGKQPEGCYMLGEEIILRTSVPMQLQRDGTADPGKSQNFRFRILPKAIKILY